MKAGLTLQELAVEVTRQNEAKRDYLVDTRELTMLVPPADGEGQIEMHLPEGAGEFGIRDVAHRQIGDRLKIPARFYDLLREEHPQLLGTNVNTLLRERPERRMVRAMDFGDGAPYMRSFLSDRYLRRDNAEVMAAAVKVLGEIPEVHIPTAQITEKFMHLTAIAPALQADVRQVGDTVQAGVRITNSEVGWGALKVEPIIYRLICTNGMTVQKATRVFHLGSQIDSEETLRVLSDEALRADDKAFFAKFADILRAAVDETQFNLVVAQLREAATGVKMERPKESMERLGKTLGFSEGEADSILGHLIEGGDLTAYGALNAVTRAAQDVESYDRSMELESAGGKILEMAGTGAWERIAVAA